MSEREVMFGHISPNLTSVSERSEQLKSLTSRNLAQLFPMWSNIRSILIAKCKTELIYCSKNYTYINIKNWDKKCLTTSPNTQFTTNKSGIQTKDFNHFSLLKSNSNLKMQSFSHEITTVNFFFKFFFFAKLEEFFDNNELYNILRFFKVHFQKNYFLIYNLPKIYKKIPFTNFKDNKKMQVLKQIQKPGRMIWSFSTKPKSWTGTSASPPWPWWRACWPCDRWSPDESRVLDRCRGCTTSDTLATRFCPKFEPEDMQRSAGKNYEEMDWTLGCSK